jgi:protein involved in polysaccharide export with SLBB domain
MRAVLNLTLFCLIVVGTGALANGQAGEPDRPRVVNEDRENLVHHGDLIDVDVLGSFEFDWRGTLTPEGFLDGMDSVGEPIYGLCRTETAIARDIERILSQTYKSPKAVVRILDRSNRAAARVDGAVRTPTRFQIKRRVSLRELLVMAGGLVDGASGEITIFRPRDLNCRGGSPPTPAGAEAQDLVNEMRTIKITDLLGGLADADPQILSGDLITVSRAFPIYVIGAVVNPRPVYSRDRMTLSRLVATAGGAAKDADPAKVFIFRRDGVEIKSIEADLMKIKKGVAPDEILRPFDIIEVASKGGGKRKYPPVIANDQNTDRSPRDLPLKIVD